MAGPHREPPPPGPPPARQGLLNLASFVVEFVGLRGVGKSTVAGEVVRALREQGTTCNRLQPYDLAGKVASRLQRYGHVATGFAFVATRRPVSWALLDSSARAYGAFAHRLAQCRRGPGVHVLDEGVFQLAFRIHRATRAQKLVVLCDDLLRRLPLPDLVVVVEAPLETVGARRQRRGNSWDRLYQRPSPAAVQSLVELKGVLRRVCLAEPRLGYLGVANEESTPPGVAAGLVATLVRERCPAARGARP